MKKLMTIVAMMALAGCLAWNGSNEPKVAYVDSFDLANTSCGIGKRMLALKSVDGNPLTVAGKTYARGFGTHPESAVAFTANGKVTAFDALVGIDDDAKKAGSGKSYGKPMASFYVWADGRIAWSAKDVQVGQKPVAVHVDLTPVR